LQKGEVKGELNFKIPEFLLDELRYEYGSSVVAVAKNISFNLVMDSSYNNGKFIINALNDQDNIASLTVDAKLTKNAFSVPKESANIEDEATQEKLKGITLTNIITNLEKAGVPSEYTEPIKNLTAEELAEELSYMF